MNVELFIGLGMLALLIYLSSLNFTHYYKKCRHILDSDGTAFFIF